VAPVRSKLFPYTTLFRSSLREEHRERQERARDALVVPQQDVFRPDATTIIEANLLLARGNFEVALQKFRRVARDADQSGSQAHRSEEHTSELQSPCNLVC